MRNISRFILATLVFPSWSAIAADPKTTADKGPGAASGPETVTPAFASANIKIAKDFKIDLVYSVPRETEGSWVAMCTDPKGRLYVSDQNGPLYRVTLPASRGGPVKTEKI